MPRPSRQLDQALLASGRELYPQLGAAALSVRALAEHAGVNAGMFHYHFESKDTFLRTLLQQLYEEMFTQLSQEIGLPGAPLQRLRQALAVLGRFLRTHGAVIGRIWADAGQGEPVAREFMQANAPRHIGLLLALFDEAERAGDIVPMPPMQRFTFVLGAVAAPVLVATRVAELGVAPKALRPLLEPQVLSDAAILARADLALAALRTPLRKDDHV